LNKPATFSVDCSMRALILLLVVILPLSALAADLPAIPASKRLLDAEEVQNYWFNTLKNQTLSKRPSGTYPLQQRIWDREQEAHKAQMADVLKSKYREEAHRAALAHNVGVYRLQEKWEALAATQAELQKILEHEAKLLLLEAQRKSTERVAQAAEREADAAEREAKAAETEAAAAVAAKENPPKVEVVVKQDPPVVQRTPVVIVPCPPTRPQPAPSTLFPQRSNR
jgi:hypothetical protein